MIYSMVAWASKELHMALSRGNNLSYYFLFDKHFCPDRVNRQVQSSNQNLSGLARDHWALIPLLCLSGVASLKSHQLIWRYLTADQVIDLWGFLDKIPGRVVVPIWGNQFTRQRCILSAEPAVIRCLIIVLGIWFRQANADMSTLLRRPIAVHIEACFAGLTHVCCVRHFMRCVTKNACHGFSAKVKQTATEFCMRFDTKGC